jgi:hypothetical protein
MTATAARPALLSRSAGTFSRAGRCSHFAASVDKMPPVCGVPTQTLAHPLADRNLTLRAPGHPVTRALSSRDPLAHRAGVEHDAPERDYKLSPTALAAAQALRQTSLDHRCASALMRLSRLRQRRWTLRGSSQRRSLSRCQWSQVVGLTRSPERKNPRKIATSERAFGRFCYAHGSMRCRSGSHCQQPAIKGRRFCAEHAAELDRMREELKDAAAARIGRGRPKRSSTCCRPGCYEPRVPPAAYCDTCAAAGYVEEAA